ncbi:serine hydrolase [Chitinophaga tropicalis]|uniref:Serine hydrolase n=1 Tax=Chitinophaga tropicalis TaxID=2683588 RepID=A0A7K1U8K5_9BACT|nr:serine hydrolase [Chitinophaga tropicalis]MVT10691.1 serine hydrolase [Chitinophaga tropicalis]
MKRLFSLFLMGIFACAHGQNTYAKLDTLLNAYTTTYKFNGTALIAKNGKIILNKGYGYRHVEDSTKNTENSIFQIGSVTKQFTAVIILKLQDEKKLNIQDKASKYFPDYPQADSFTIAQLMAHTAGVYNYTSDRDFMQNEVTKYASREKIFNIIRNKQLQFKPGTDWAYSNSGYMLLGYIIEDVTHKPYYQVVRDYIFTPLHMDHSGFDFTHLVNKDKATGYFKLTETGSTASTIVDSSVSFAAGAIYSTTADLYKWHQALQHYKIIPKATLEQAYTPVLHKYGYGLDIDSTQGKRMISHTGGIHGFTSILTRIPEDDVCVILLNNAPGGLNKLSNSIVAALYDQPYDIPRTRQAISVSEDVLKQYVGEYELRPGFTIVFTVKDGALIGQPTKQDPAQLYAEKEDYFFLKVVDAQVKFTRNEKNEVDGMVLYQNDNETKGKKIK